MTKNNITEKFIYSTQVIELVKTANNFCLLIEESNNDKKKAFILKSIKILSELYSNYISIDLPKDLPQAETQKFVSESDWVYIEDIIKTRLGTDNQVIELQEPENPTEVINTELSECYADIYQVLKDFTLLYEMGSAEATEAGFTEFIELINNYAAPRTLLIIKELHNMFFGIQDIKEEEKQETAGIQKNNSTEDENRWVNQLFDEDEK